MNVAVLGKRQRQHRRPVKDPLIAERRRDIRSVCELIAGADGRIAAVNLRDKTVAMIGVILQTDKSLPETALGMGNASGAPGQDTAIIDIEIKVPPDAVAGIQRYTGIESA